MAENLSPVPVLRFFDNNGATLSGGKLFTYAGGTTTKLATYTDSTGGTPNTNPIILDSTGQCNCWIPPGVAYKFVLSPSTDSDPPTNPFWTVDSITSGISTIPNGTDTGSVNAYVATGVTGVTANGQGVAVFLKIAHTNTGASTLNVNAQGALNIVLANGAAPPSGSLLAGMMALFIGDGTHWQLLNPQSVGLNISNLLSFGADPTGVNDSAAAIQAWLNTVGPNAFLYAPAGIYAFGSGQLTAGSMLNCPCGNMSNFSIRGAGRGATIFKYIGSNATNNLLTFGGSGSQFINADIGDFTLTSTTQLTGGAAIFAYDANNSRLSNLILGDGNYTLNNQMIIAGYASVSVGDFHMYGKGHGLYIYGSAAFSGAADIYIGGGGSTINGYAAGPDGANGIYCSGGTGGVYIDNIDVIQKNVGLFIDEVTYTTAGQQYSDYLVGPIALFDSSNAANVYLNSPNGRTLMFKGWSGATAAGASGISVQHFGDGNGNPWDSVISFSGARVLDAAADGILLQSSLFVNPSQLTIQIDSSTSIAQSGAYGIAATSAFGISCACRPIGNSSGAFNGNISNKFPLTGAFASSATASSGSIPITDSTGTTYYVRASATP